MGRLAEYKRRIKLLWFSIPPSNASLNMKYFQATGLLLAGVVGANARTFTVFNACPFTIWYVQSTPPLLKVIDADLM